MIREAAEKNPTEKVSPAHLRIGDILTLSQFIEKEELDPRQMGVLEMNDEILFPSFLKNWEMTLTVTGLFLAKAERIDGSDSMLAVNVSVAVLDSVDEIFGAFWAMTTEKVERLMFTDTSWLT